MPLADLDLPGHWEGSASGTARLEGSYERPRIRFAASGDAVGVNGLRLGTLQAGGTMASMLELGAGFHPDFTGRENLFLNASILGIPDREIGVRIEDTFVVRRDGVETLCRSGYGMEP